MRSTMKPARTAMQRHGIVKTLHASQRNVTQSAAPMPLLASTSIVSGSAINAPSPFSARSPMMAGLRPAPCRLHQNASSRGLATWASLWPSSSSAEPSSQSGTNAEASTSATTLESLEKTAEEAVAPATSAAADTVERADSWMEQFVSPLVPYVETLPDLLYVPESVPYRFTISIIIATVLLRSTITLPVMIWHRRRMRRMTEIVVPAFARLKETLPVVVAKRSRRQRLSYQEYEKELQRELKTQLKVLTRENRCAPLPTIVLPLAVSMPLLIVVSMTLRTALLDPTSALTTETIPWWSPPADLKAQFDAGAKILAARGIEGEALAKLSVIQGPTLAEVDKSMIGPISVGLLNMINTELGQWLRRGMVSESTIEQRDLEKELAKRGEDVENESQERRVSVRAIRAGQHGKTAVSTTPSQNSPITIEKTDLSPIRSSVIGNVLRAAAIAFVVVASQAPAALVIYWISSASYTCVQSTAFAIADHRRSIRTNIPPRSGKAPSLR